MKIKIPYTLNFVGNQKIKNQKPKTKNQKPKTKNQKPKTKLFLTFDPFFKTYYFLIFSSIFSFYKLFLNERYINFKLNISPFICFSFFNKINNNISFNNFNLKKSQFFWRIYSKTSFTWFYTNITHKYKRRLIKIGCKIYKMKQNLYNLQTFRVEFLNQFILNVRDKINLLRPLYIKFNKRIKNWFFNLIPLQYNLRDYSLNRNIKYFNIFKEINNTQNIYFNPFINKKDFYKFSFKKNINKFFPQNHVITSYNNLYYLFNYPLLFKYYFFYKQFNINFNTIPQNFFSKNLNPFSSNLILKSNIYFKKQFKPFLAVSVSSIMDEKHSHWNVFFLPLINFVSFFELILGKKICFYFNASLHEALTFLESMRCRVWYKNLLYFKKVLGHHLFLIESLQIIYTAIKLQDPIFLINWMKTMFTKINFFKYKFFLRYVGHVIRSKIQPYFPESSFKGVKFRLKGKVGVAGNSRTRTVYEYIGKTGQSTLNTRILTTTQVIWTFTGSLGLKIWFYF